MDVHYSQLIWIISILLTCYVGFFLSVCLSPHLFGHFEQCQVYTITAPMDHQWSELNVICSVSMQNIISQTVIEMAWFLLYCSISYVDKWKLNCKNQQRQVYQHHIKVFSLSMNVFAVTRVNTLQLLVNMVHSHISTIHKSITLKPNLTRYLSQFPPYVTDVVLQKDHYHTYSGTVQY